MEYKTNRNLKIRAFDPLGTAFYLAGLILIANSIEVGSGETNPGVILEYNSIDQKLNGDFLG